VEKYRNPRATEGEYIYPEIKAILKYPLILILPRITDFSTTGSAGLKHRNNGRKYVILKFNVLSHILMLKI
jgi:hypothetical protein